MNLRQIAIALGLTLGSFGCCFGNDIPPADLERASLLNYADNAGDLILRALAFVGVNYQRGGESPETGFDCSGLVRHVFRESLGLVLPRTSKEISRMGETIRREELLPGDLVFFNTLRRGFSHVGIYLGENRFVHAPASGGEVRVEDMRQGYWIKRFNGARRIVAGIGDS